MNRLLLIFSLIITSTRIIIAQNFEVIPPSPEAASLGVYGSVPVSTYTGVPDISIPIHTISYKDVQIPISISYHAGGIRVEDEASWVGLGWTLNAGGVITRSVVDRDDLGAYQKGLNLGSIANWRGYPFDTRVHTLMTPSYDPIVGGDAGTFGDIWLGTNISLADTDLEPDVFYFNFLGRSGKFILYQGQLSTARYVYGEVLDAEDTKIYFDSQDKTWHIKTNDGYEYIFGTIEITERHKTSYNVANYYQLPYEQREPYFGNYGEDLNITAWYLDKIISPNNNIVELIYDVENDNTLNTTKISKYGTKSFLQKAETYETLQAKYLDMACYNTSPSNWIPDYVNTYKNFYYRNQVYLKEINTPLEKIVFSKAPRSDIYLVNEDGKQPYILPINKGPQRLTEIQVIDKTSNNTINKRFLLNNDSYFNPSGDKMTKRLKLTGIKECNGDLSICNGNGYTFEYNESISLPRKDSYSQDFWGFFNNKNNISLIPRGTWYIPSIYNPVVGQSCEFVLYLGHANRQPDELYMQAGILKKITYPTGGYTDFEFEANDYSVFGDYREDELKITDFEEVNEAYLLGDNTHYAGTRVSNLTITQSTFVTVERYMEYENCYNYGCSAGYPPSYGGINDYSENYLQITGNDGQLPKSYSMNEYKTKLDDFLNQCQSGMFPGDEYCRFDGKTELLLAPGTYQFTLFNPNNAFNVGYNVKGKASPPKREVSFDPVKNSYAKKAGGLRIKSIKSYHQVGDLNPLTKKYVYTKYSPNGAGINSSSGRLMFYPSHHTRAVRDIMRGDQHYYTPFIKSNVGNTTALGSRSQGNIVGYDRVFEYNLDKEGNHIGYVEYSYHNQEYENIHALAHSSVLGGYYSLSNYPLQTDTRNGLPLNKKIYDKSNTLLQEERYEYTRYIKRFNIAVAFEEMYGNREYNGWGILYRSYIVYCDKYLLNKTESKLYASSSNQSLTTIEENFYEKINPYVHLNITRKEKYDSQGKKLITQYKYPLDYPVTNCIPTLNTCENTHKTTMETCTTNRINGLDQNCVYATSITIYGKFNNNGVIEDYESSKPINGEGCVDFSLPLYFDWSTAVISPSNNITISGNSTTPRICYSRTNCQSYYEAQYQTCVNQANANYTQCVNTYNTCLDAQITNPNLSMSERSLYKMQQQHILSPVIEQSTWQQKSSTAPLELISAQKTDYQIQTGEAGKPDFVVPQSISTTNLTEPIVNGNPADYYESRAEFTYTPQGNLKTQNKVRDRPTVYLWGYKHTYPIAEIKGATYAEVEAALTTTTLNNLASSSILNDTQITQLNNLRTALPQAFISTYTYEPLKGLKTAWDANGQKTTYDYDEFGRLLRVRDFEGNILKQYEYHYKGD